MTGPFATTKIDRRKHIRILQDRAAHCDHCATIKFNNNMASEAAKGFLDQKEAGAIRFALSFVERHVNLETGELTIPLDEPEETA